MNLKAFDLPARLCAALFLCFSIGACSDDDDNPPDDPPVQDPPDDSDKSLSGWIDSLPAEYQVSQGSVALQDAETCDQFIAVFGSCYGNNPATPYILLQPPVDDTAVDPIYAEPFSETVGEATVNYFHKLAETDALVTLVSLPPEAAYFGFNTYMFTRPLTAYDFAGEPSNLSPNPERVEVFGSVGDAVNQEIIETRSGAALGSGQTVAIITTANQALYDALAQNLADYGLDSALAIAEPLGSNIRPGSGTDADDLFTIVRYAMPDDTSAGDAWTAAIEDHIAVYRISAPDVAVERYGEPSYSEKADGNELSLIPARDELADLLSGWLAQYQTSTTDTTAMMTSVSTSESGDIDGLIGEECIADGSQCFGDSQDTEAYRFTNGGVIPSGATAIVVGAMHTVLDNARYASVAIYDSDTFTGVGGAVQSSSYGTLQGSAERVLEELGLIASASPELRDELPNLYVVLVSRGCPIQTDDCIEISPSDIDVEDAVLLTQRAYLKPGTTTGADPDTMLNPLVISGGLFTSAN